jgi:hypothetical protein
MHISPPEGYADSKPAPATPGLGACNLGHLYYRSVHFYGPRLADALAETVRYLEESQELNGRVPQILCLHDAFSFEDEGSDLAWQVTLVVSHSDGGLP